MPRSSTRPNGYGTAGPQPTARSAPGKSQQAHQTEPPLDLSVMREPERWAEELGAEILSTGTLRRRSGGLVDALPGFDEGVWWVQDAAAALPALLLGAIKGRRVLDIGAAPGGKTAQLCVVGAEVTALERSPRRAEFLVRNLGRLTLDAEIVVADALEWRPPRRIDAVLLDAPCTATGTIRRHPDVPWAKSPADVERLAETQARLLDGRLGFLKPGGILVYAVCSLQPEEGRAGSRRSSPAARRSSATRSRRAELSGLPVELTAAGEVRTLPCHLGESGGLDGFFIARLAPRRLIPETCRMTLSPDPTGSAVGPRQDRPGRARPWAECRRDRAALDRRHRARPARGRHAVASTSARSPAPRRSWTAGSRRCTPASMAGSSPAATCPSIWRPWPSTACRRSIWSW